MSKAGRCHICGKYRKYTKEHIPPQAAFNQSPVVLYGFNAALRNGWDSPYPWDFSGQKGRPMNKGVWFKRLCEECNTQLLGIHYVPAYSDLVKQTYVLLEKGVRINKDGFGTFEFSNLYPLKIAKKVIAMFLGINAPEMIVAEPELQRFVLRQEQRALSEKYSLYMFVAGGQLSRYCGLTILLRGFGTGSSVIRPVSELATFPLGFLLEIDAKQQEKQLTDIRFLANDYCFDDCVDLRLSLPVRETNTMFPLDYRNQKQVTVDRIKSLLDQVQRQFKVDE